MSQEERVLGESAVDEYPIDATGGLPQVTGSAPKPAPSAVPGVNYTYSDFLYTFAFDSYGNPTIAYDFDVINQSIQMILSTSPGERVMLPLFGCNINSYIFEACTPLNARLLELDIEDALAEFENRVIVTGVVVTISINQQAFYITINYTLAATGQPSTYQAQLQTQTL